MSRPALKVKLDVDCHPSRIPGACNPSFAKQALCADPRIGALTSCNVVVWEPEDGQIGIDFMNPQAVPKLVELPVNARGSRHRAQTADAGADGRGARVAQIGTVGPDRAGGCRSLPQALRLSGRFGGCCAPAFSMATTSVPAVTRRPDR